MVKSRRTPVKLSWMFLIQRLLWKILYNLVGPNNNPTEALNLIELDPIIENSLESSKTQFNTTISNHKHDIPGDTVQNPLGNRLTRYYLKKPSKVKPSSVKDRKKQKIRVKYRVPSVKTHGNPVKTGLTRYYFTKPSKTQ